ncbi:hypothetical protein PG985_000188 [Apiospora marii]|uniref:Uncharacterized protein n=1 Tax=Apiospora marii TaxID=335849 RepID=A0ABR1R1A6_9PEZI
MVDLTSTGPSEVFRYFPRLPPEVRSMIWEWAARSLRTKRGAYFFTFQNLSFVELEKATKVDWQVSCQPSKGDNWQPADRSLPKIPDAEFPELSPRTRRWHLTAPYWDHTRVTSNSPTRNPSTYMIHGGLWAACRDSHQALRRRMQKVRRSVRRQLQAAANDPQRYSHQMEVSGTFLRNDKERMSFTLYPERDLVCLQIPLDQAHLYEFPRSLEDYNNYYYLHMPFDRPKHIALEFDPSWKVDLKPEWNLHGPMEGLAGLICYLLEEDARTDQRLWFIDYRLQRNGWKPEVKKPWILEPGQHAFRGNGCKFVDVSSSFEYWDTRPRQNPEPAGTYHHVHTLYRDLNKRIKELEDSRNDWTSENWPDDDDLFDGDIRKIGVLACVWDEQ